MILRLLTFLLLHYGNPALAQGSSLSFPSLVDETLATTARPVRFDWRNQTALVDFSLAQPVELNNFESRRFSLAIAFPGQGFVPFISLGYVKTSATPSSEAITKTPYRQVGRPSRVELRAGALYPLAEGIVTLRPAMLPAAEFVLSAKGTVSYLLYPSALHHKSWSSVFSTLFSPKISNSEMLELRKNCPGGMTIDPARFNVLTGISLTLFSATGLYLTPEVQVALPSLGTNLGFWWDLSLGAGYAF